MRILYVASRYNYGKPEQGYSFEHYNFYDFWRHLGVDLFYFDFPSLMQAHGREWMNRRLLEVAKTEKPDVMFTVLFTSELDPAVVREISENTDTITLNWFCDDHWRFDNYSRYWAPCFNWAVTTDASALPKYARLGYRNVIKSQWACNHLLYRRFDLPPAYDVTFVGLPHGNRRQVIQELREAGIDVRVWGTGWEAGRLSQEEMIRVFNQSRINLNLSNASKPVVPASKRIKKAAREWASRSLEALPFGANLKAWRRERLSQRPPAAPAGTMPPPARAARRRYPNQIKGRNFEIPGCGGFLLTGNAEDLGNYYEIGREVVCFENTRDLIEKIRYYLAHEAERAAIAQAGYERTLQEHTYAHRFVEIFRRMGLPPDSLDALLAGETRAGQVVEVR